MCRALAECPSGERPPPYRNRGWAETLLLLHHMIDDGRNLVPPAVAADPAQRFGLLLHDGRPRVAVLEDPMAEAHDALFACQGHPHPSLRPLGLSIPRNISATASSAPPLKRSASMGDALPRSLSSLHPPTCHAARSSSPKS